MVTKELLICLLVYGFDMLVGCIFREKKTYVLLVFYWLFDKELVKKPLCLNFVWRVNSNELWQLHLEDPVDIEIIKKDVEYISLGTRVIVKHIMQKF